MTLNIKMLVELSYFSFQFQRTEYLKSLKNEFSFFLLFQTVANTFFDMVSTAAKAALRRKKQYEHTLEQTSAQMMTVEREIASIETANINKETLDAMKNASAAMKHIHKGLTVDKVDQTMCVKHHYFSIKIS